MIKDDDIFDGIIGGKRISDKDVRKDIFEPKDLKIESELDRKLARLLMLHPKLQVNFRSKDLADIDEKTKRTLLADMYNVLGITPTV